MHPRPAEPLKRPPGQPRTHNLAYAREILARNVGVKRCWVGLFNSTLPRFRSLPPAER
jgi:hypothetical protein